jgi:hypothetical protein
VQGQPIVKQIVIGSFLGFLIALIHALGASDPDPILSPHGVGRLLAGAVGGALVYMAVYRAWPRDR